MAQVTNDTQNKSRGQLQVAASLRAIFAQGHPELRNDLPGNLLKAVVTDRTERVLGITSVGLAQLLDVGLTQPTLKLATRALDRGYQEYFSDFTQVVTAACIHTSNRVLLLSLVKPQAVEGYRPGTLTYPQGHVQYTDRFANSTTDGQTTMHGLLSHARDEVYRELMEEIHVEDFYTNLKFFEELKERLYGFRIEDIVHPIYIDLSGTMHRHVCLLFDVDMSGTCFDDVVDLIVSGEPEKHSVRICSYADLEAVDRIDDICPWVRTSIPVVPFYTKTFVPVRKTKGVN